MSKISCKKCPQCGLYNDISVVTCECGGDVTYAPTSLIDPNMITGDEYGELDVYVQKCSYCGALNFTTDPHKRVTVCSSCGKSRIAEVNPVLYADYDLSNNPNGEEKELETNNPKQTGEKLKTKLMAQFPPVVTDSDEDDEDLDDEAIKYIQTISGNIRNCVDTNIRDNSINCPNENKNEGDDINWSDVLAEDTQEKTEEALPGRQSLTLTAIRYGRHSFTVWSGETNRYLLGRDANQAKFLEQDERVSNEHCYLVYKDDGWWVEDNHSANGTFVNLKDIGLNGKRKLTEGDTIRLGHWDDSIEFRVRINK